MNLENITSIEYVHNHPEIIIGDEIKPGKDQYGKAQSNEYGNSGDIDAIRTPVTIKHFSRILRKRC